MHIILLNLINTVIKFQNLNFKFVILQWLNPIIEYIMNQNLLKLFYFIMIDYIRLILNQYFSLINFYG